MSICDVRHCVCVHCVHCVHEVNVHSACMNIPVGIECILQIVFKGTRYAICSALWLDNHTNLAALAVHMHIFIDRAVVALKSIVNPSLVSGQRQTDIRTSCILAWSGTSEFCYSYAWTPALILMCRNNTIPYIFILYDSSQFFHIFHIIHCWCFFFFNDFHLPYTRIDPSVSPKEFFDIHL